MKWRTTSPRPIRPEREEGFTVVEMMMSMLILILISTVTAVTIIGSLQQVSVTHQKQIATYLPQPAPAPATGPGVHGPSRPPVVSVSWDMDLVATKQT